MGDTSIEWCDKVWNPVRGCELADKSCENCYAMRQAHRFSGKGGKYEGLTALGNHGPRWNGNVRTVPEMLAAPLGWKKPAEIFVNSMSDLFHADVPFEYIAAVFGVMAACAQHQFIVLTKRDPRPFFAWANEPEACAIQAYKCANFSMSVDGFLSRRAVSANAIWPLINVSIGISAGTQKRFDERILWLAGTPAAKRFVSLEPLLEPISLQAEYLAAKCDGTYPFPMLEDKHRTKMVDLLDGVIVGCESGPRSRPANLEWMRDIIQQCAEAKTDCFLKQIRISEDMRHSRVSGDPSEWPADLRVRKLPWRK